jgi:hypothetical protein
MQWRRLVAIATASLLMASVGACAANGAGDATGDDAAPSDPDDAGVEAVPDAHAASSFDVAPLDTGPGFDATPGASGDSGGGGGSTAGCAYPNDCQGAANVQSISGDTGSDTRTVSGYTSKWLQILVTEDDHSPIGRKLHIAATLTSPPGLNFDLYLYVDEGGTPTSRACGPTPNESSTNPAGQPDTVSHRWGEGAIANNSDDSRIVSLEVRHVDGACDPNAKWTLTITGN